MNDFDNKVVIVTGGSSGIGEATAAKFLQEGAIVYIVGRDKDRLAAAKKRLNSEKVHEISADISIPNDCKSTVEHVIEKQGCLDILVNCAGVYFEGPSQDVTEEIWDVTIDTNLKGTFFMCRYALPALIKSEGCIVNTSSDAGLTGNAEAAAYCASKGGVTLLTKALAMEYSDRKVRVNAICPGVVETEMIIKDFEASSFTSREEYDKFYLAHYPQGENARYTQPEEVAECISFLASTKKVQPITGACLSIDFGITAGY